MQMRKLLMVVVGLLGLASQAAAEPYLAIREGYKCSACHVNMTGGGKRTEFVSAHARQLLHYPDFFPSLSKPVDSFNGELLSPYVAIGADVRTSLTATFQELGNNGRVDNNTAFRGRLEEIEVDLDEAVAFLEVRPIPDVLTFYIDQSFGSQSTTREVWGMLRLPWEFYLKGGKMFLPYGLQLQDDNAFIRGGRNGSVTTGFSFDEQQNAFEVGWEPGPVAAAFAVSDGTSSDKDVQVTTTVYSLFTDVPVVRSVLLGGSFSHVAPPGAETFVWGFFTGFNLGRFTYLGEVDFREDKDKNDGEPSTDEFRGRFIHYSEGNYLLFNWLNLKVAFDYADDDGDLRQRVDDSENRVSVGLEPFWSKFLQTRLFYRVSNGIESNPSHNQDLWSLEVHMFF